ncbi:MAG TPA: DNA polymerase III subunit delta [Vicinamibacterales bacterium]|nr:DNA polymerase III subunit delta [Vicinamibacterales bacterium]
MPVANPETLRADAAAGRLQPVYLLVGDDDRLATALVNAIADTLEDDLRAFNYERIYASDKGVTPAAVVEAARILPMMAARRVVVVLRAETWLKPKRGVPDVDDEAAEVEAQGDDKGAMGPLLEYLKAPLPTASVVFIAADVHKGSPAAKALYRNATVVECWGLGDRDASRGGDVMRQALAVVREMAAAAGRQFDPAAAQLLAQRSGGDIARLRADIDHALLFAQGRRAITRADVEAVVSDRETVQDHWAMVNALERGDAAVALRQLALVLEEGAAPVLVLGQLAWFAREKLPRLRHNQVPAAVQAVFRTDLDLKSSAGDARVLLERLVLELCQAVKPRRA